METPKDVLISGDRHLIIHGQFGNLLAKISELRAALVSGDLHELLPPVENIAKELGFLMEIYPAIDGRVKYDKVKAVSGGDDPGPTQQKIWDGRLVVRNKLRDMRALADAAYVSYTHEGTIACHLKVMFDEAWRGAADEVGLEDLDLPPF